MQSLHFLYHELRPVPSSYSYVLECSQFEAHCELFRSLNAPPAGFLRPAITFDDGHRSNYEFALPILQRHGLAAHFFITAGWTGQRAGYMDRNEVRALHAAGQTIGAHGWSHTLLTHCTGHELDRELGGARQSLEDTLGAPVTSMSLPGGRANRRVLDACWNAGYTAVYTSMPHPVPDGASPRSTIGRLNIRNGASTDWLQRVLQPSTGLLSKLEREQRIKHAAQRVMGDSLYARLWALLNRQEAETDPAGAPAK